jgi:hypothetical protein
MLIKIKNDLLPEEKKSMSMEEINLFKELKKFNADTYYVYGVFIKETKNIYLIRLQGRGDVFTFANAVFFEILDGTVSDSWCVMLGAGHQQMAYFDFDFSKFIYLGIPRFVEECDFYERYHTDDTEALSYMTEMRLKIEGF